MYCDLRAHIVIFVDPLVTLNIKNTKMKPIISVSNFYKSFGDLQVIQDLNFQVLEGELFAFLGANGSGKTTTLRCLLNIYQADKGELLINGKKYTTEDSDFIGYLPEERGLYTTSKVMDTMVYFGQIKGMDKKSAEKEVLEYLERVGLPDKKDVVIKNLSSGQQQKIQLGITLLNKPKLLILDEPTKGLDPVNTELLLDMLKELNEKNNTTIIFSTHQMDQVEKIAQKLLMLKDGKSRLYGYTDEVKKQFGEKTIILEYKGKFKKNDKLFTAVVDSNYAEIDPKDGVSENEVLKYLLTTDIQIIKFGVTTPSLNQIFIKVASN